MKASSSLAWRYRAMYGYPMRPSAASRFARACTMLQATGATPGSVRRRRIRFLGYISGAIRTLLRPRRIAHAHNYADARQKDTGSVVSLVTLGDEGSTSARLIHLESACIYTCTLTYTCISFEHPRYFSSWPSIASPSCPRAQDRDQLGTIGRD